MTREGLVGKRHRQKKRKNKINLVFDEAKRRDFLGGFHKRKVQRQKVAQAELQEKLKEERKRIKQEAKDSYKKMVVSRRPIPELQDLFKNEYETEETTVKIVELSTDDLSEKNNWIGQNKPKANDDDEEQSDSSESEVEEIPGMELKVKKENVKSKTDAEKKPTATFKSKKDITKKIKKEATKNVKKSKAFQMKSKIEQLKNKKKSRQKKKLRVKSASKKGKARHRMQKGRDPATSR